MLYSLRQFLAVVSLCCAPALAQSVSGMGSVAGTVTDPTGAIIPQADVTLTDSKGQGSTLQSDAQGVYKFIGVAPGIYTLSATAQGFAKFERPKIIVTAGHTLTVNISLKIEVQEQQVTVSDEGLDTSPDKNGGAIIMKGHDLDALADNPDDLRTQLQAIAGADPESGAQFFVDGFSGGKMPPKSSIREIRINQNPYSAQYDSPGMGRIEIFTKPGTDKLHADLFVEGNDSSFNSRNPYVQQQPPYYSTMLDGDVNGPINKHLSFFLDGMRQSDQTQSFIHAIVLGPSLQPQQFVRAVSSPVVSTYFMPRIDFAFGKVHTISLRYSLIRSSQNNTLTSQFSLPSQATISNSNTQTLQFSDTQTYGEKLVNETRFQYIRSRSLQTSASHDPTITVQGAFTGGGNNLGDSRDNQDSYELQDYASIAMGGHFLKFGGRYRATRDASRSTGGFNGQFIFPSLTAYQITEQGLAAGWTPSRIRAAGGGAGQFTITTGNPNIAVLMQDLGVYVEDEWKMRPNMTLSYGIRFETQTGIADHADFGPRFDYAWSIGTKKNKPPFAILRAGAGIFYQRFASTYLANAERQNGTKELQYVVNAPDTYPDFPPLQAAVSPTIYRISPLLHAPYTVQESITLEKTIAQKLNISLNYFHTRGVDDLITRNINAPLPGTYDPSDPTSGVRPFGGTQNIYEYESEGASKANRLFTNVTYRTKTIGFYGYYTFGYHNANTSGSGGFPSNGYDLRADWGRASNDSRHRLFFGGWAQLPYRFSINPFLIYQSSSPFNITVGEDLNGDSQFNDRPAFATDLDRASVYRTKWGNFDADPLPGQKIIPVNYGIGPSYFTANLRLSRGFRFGPVVPDNTPPPPPGASAKATKKPEKKEIERKYNLNLNISAQNVFNYVNPSEPVGVLSSPLFGKATALGGFFSSSPAGNRTVYLGMWFSF